MSSKDIFPNIYDDMLKGFAAHDAIVPDMPAISAAYQAYSVAHGIDAGAYLAAETFSDRMSGLDMDALMGNMALMSAELAGGMDFISSLYYVSDSWPLEQALGIMADRHFHVEFDGLSGVSLDQLPDDVDIDELCKATARAISSEKVEDKDSLAEHIISGYEQRAADEKDNTAIKPDRSVVEFFLEKVFIPLIIELIILFISNALSSKAPEIDVHNDITVINNYYVNGSKLDAATLNAFNWRLVCRDSIVRVRPDRKSAVVAELKPGQLVQIYGKNKKWREIGWNDGKTMLSGWIQNYRLREFRKC